jgi:hypothetical protein
LNGIHAVVSPGTSKVKLIGAPVHGQGDAAPPSRAKSRRRQVYCQSARLEVINADGRRRK